MVGRSKKATFALHEETLGALHDAVANGAAPSKNALVERALTRELQLLRREARRAQWEEATKDPAFLQDISELDLAFRSADAETARGLD